MECVLKTAPVKYPVTLDETKNHLRVSLSNTDFDSEITDNIQVATEEAEEFTYRRFITQTWKLFLHRWPDKTFITFPFGKLQGVNFLKYTDTGGTTYTWDTSNYLIDTDSEPGKLVLAYGVSWPPSDLQVYSPIEIEFTCGYGDNEGDVPANIRRAIKIAAADLFLHHESVITSPGSGGTNLKTVERLLWPKRLYGAWDTELE